MQRAPIRPDQMDVTAAAIPLGGVPLSRPGTPTATTPPPRRARGIWTDPNVLTVGVLLATGIAVIARHPLARMIGTEVDVAAPTTVAAPVVPAHSASHAASVPFGPSVPAHAPRDPFRALVNPEAKTLAPVVGSPAAASSAVGATGSASSTGSVGSCAGSWHLVAPGDSLWSLAARAVGSSDSGRVTVAWHRLYAANRPPLGADPALIPAGQKLCVPTGL